MRMDDSFIVVVAICDFIYVGDKLIMYQMDDFKCGCAKGIVEADQ